MEFLPQTEPLHKPAASEPIPLAGLSMPDIEGLAHKRQSDLTSLEGKISRKMLFALEEKLEKEKSELIKLLEWQTGKKIMASKYTLILDPSVFEQKFFNSTNY